MNSSYQGGLTSSTSRSRETNLEGILSARRAIGAFDIVVNAGGNIRRNDGDFIYFATRSLLVPEVYDLSNSATTPTIIGGIGRASRGAINSTYGSIVSTFRHVWTVELTGRKDRLSTLPKENAGYFYPSINTSLIVSDIVPSLRSGTGLSYLKAERRRPPV